MLKPGDTVDDFCLLTIPAPRSNGRACVADAVWSFSSQSQHTWLHQRSLRVSRYGIRL